MYICVWLRYDEGTCVSFRFVQLLAWTCKHCRAVCVNCVERGHGCTHNRCTSWSVWSRVRSDHTNVIVTTQMVTNATNHGNQLPVVAVGVRSWCLSIVYNGVVVPTISRCAPGSGPMGIPRAVVQPSHPLVPNGCELVPIIITPNRHPI